MSTLYLLFFLLVVAYLGGFLMGGRGLRGWGLPSGSEWVVLGFILGPAALGALGARDIDSFTPLVTVAIGWIALLAGLSFGMNGTRRIHFPRLATGFASGILCGAAVAAATWLTLRHVPAAGDALPDSRDRLLVALGTGAALAGTSRHALQWAVERLGARGRLTDLIGDVVQSDDLVPLLAAGLIIGAKPSQGVRTVPGVGIAIGAVLGALTAVLLGREMRRSWLSTLLFGVSLLAIGVAQQLDVSVLATLFALGLGVALASPLRAEIRAMPGRVEGPIVLPALLIAGSRVTLGNGTVLWVVGAAVLARLAASAVAAALVAATNAEARRAGPILALGLGATGPLNVTVALAFQLRFPGPVGDAILAATAAAAVAGEFVGPPALRRALRRAGDLPDAATTASAGPGAEAAA